MSWATRWSIRAKRVFVRAPGRSGGLGTKKGWPFGFVILGSRANCQLEKTVGAGTNPARPGDRFDATNNQKRSRLIEMTGSLGLLEEESGVWTWQSKWQCETLLHELRVCTNTLTWSVHQRYTVYGLD